MSATARFRGNPEIEDISPRPSSTNYDIGWLLTSTGYRACHRYRE
jgi:hypothetical protein